VFYQILSLNQIILTEKCISVVFFRFFLSEGYFDKLWISLSNPKVIVVSAKLPFLLGFFL